MQISGEGEMNIESFPTREDANRLSEIGMLIFGYLMRSEFGLPKSKYITDEHHETIMKTFSFIMDIVFKKERES